MKKPMIAIVGGAAMLSALMAGYFLSQGQMTRGLVFAIFSVILMMVLFVGMRTRQQESDPATPRSRYTRTGAPVAMNLAFYGELNRLIDEGKDISGYLRTCNAPQNIVKSVNIGGATAWYYHKDGMGFNVFCAEFPHGEVPTLSHPHIKDQHLEAGDGLDTHYITIDLYRALWSWGEAHPQKKRYSNSMRLAFHGAYQVQGSDDNSFLDKTIEEVKAERKANKKDPDKKKKRRKSNIN